MESLTEPMERSRRCDGHGLSGGQRAIQQSISGAEAAIHDVEDATSYRRWEIVLIGRTAPHPDHAA